MRAAKELRELDTWMQGMRLFGLLIIVTLTMAASAAVAADGEQVLLQEEVWALPLPVPTIAYVVRPIGDGPFPLAIMNHGVSLDPVQRGFFPLVEFRDAAMWFARRGYMVVAPSGSGYGAAAVEAKDVGLFSGVFFSKVGKCSNPNFRDAGLAVAKLNLWIIEYMSQLKRVVPDNTIVVGQSAGGWAAIALSSVNPAPVKAIITFAAGRGGRVDGKPNNNCAPDKLVEATGEFGRTSRVPMLWLYIENDTYFGPELSKRMHAAFTAAGGNADYHLFPPHGNDGHFFVDAADAVPIWSPLVAAFLDHHK